MRMAPRITSVIDRGQVDHREAHISWFSSGGCCPSEHLKGYQQRITNMQGKVLITGATGYVGGRLVPRLLAAGYDVRCMARDVTRLEGRAWHGAEIVRGDLLEPDTLQAS